MQNVPCTQQNSHVEEVCFVGDVHTARFAPRFKQHKPRGLVQATPLKVGVVLSNPNVSLFFLTVAVYSYVHLYMYTMSYLNIGVAIAHLEVHQIKFNTCGVLKCISCSFIGLALACVTKVILSFKVGAEDTVFTMCSIQYHNSQYNVKHVQDTYM